jgi:hypothetical protein
MVIVGRIVLKDPNGSGRVEVTISHNAQPGCRYEADHAAELVRTALVEQAGEDLTIEFPGVWAG